MTLREFLLGLLVAIVLYGFGRFFDWLDHHFYPEESSTAWGKKWNQHEIIMEQAAKERERVERQRGREREQASKKENQEGRRE